MPERSCSVDYTKTDVSPSYKCSKCGSTGCKLWREYQSFRNPVELLCAKCAAESQNKDISDIDSEGRYSLDPKKYGSGQKSDQIGWFVPAVPTEQNDTFWGYTSVPQAGCSWWAKLPTHPEAAEAS
jgi:hypothetical protein